MPHSRRLINVLAGSIVATNLGDEVEIFALLDPKDEWLIDPDKIMTQMPKGRFYDNKKSATRGYNYYKRRGIAKLPAHIVVGRTSTIKELKLDAV